MSDRGIAIFSSFSAAVTTSPAACASIGLVAALFPVPRSACHRKPTDIIRREGRRQMPRSWMTGILAGVAALSCVTQAAAQRQCKPALALNDIQFSESQPPTLERRWSATVSVDASRCAPNSRGQFEIVFSRLKEIGVELEFPARFEWLPPSVKVEVDFWADEAVEVKGYWIRSITPCECAP